MAHKNFVKYAERFRTLDRITEYEDDLLIEKLNNIMKKNMCLVLIGYKSHGQVSKEWGNYLDMLLAIYKKVHPEKVQGHIFTKKKDMSTPIEEDTVENETQKKKKLSKKEETKKRREALSGFKNKNKRSRQ